MIPENNSDPLKSIYQQDLEHAFYSFCSYVCITRNKKMNIASIFITLLNDNNLLDVFMTLCDHDSKYDAARAFLTIEPSLQKSKYLK